MEIDLVGERLLLLSQRAIFWPRHAALILADLHLGKAATFRRSGIPVPEATTETNLNRLSDLVRTHQAQRMIILGDFFHARQGRTEEVLNQFCAWRTSHSELRIDLVMGNHDRHAGPPPSPWKFVVHDQPMLLAPFRLCHEPVSEDDGIYSLAGHLHPSIRIKDLGQSIRLPVFAFARTLAILPSFGDFTGSAVIAASDYSSVYAIADDQVFQIPPEASSTRRKRRAVNRQQQ